jgi:hypothetical protein
MIHSSFAMLGWAEIILILAAFAVLAVTLAVVAAALFVIIRSASKRKPSNTSGVPPILNK